MNETQRAAKMAELEARVEQFKKDDPAGYQKAEKEAAAWLAERAERIKTFEKEVVALVAGGRKLSDAIREIAGEHPDLHADFLERAQHGQAARLG